MDQQTYFCLILCKIYRKLAYWKSKVIKFVWKTVFSAFLKLFIYNLKLLYAVFYSPLRTCSQLVTQAMNVIYDLPQFSIYSIIYTYLYNLFHF